MSRICRAVRAVSWALRVDAFIAMARLHGETETQLGIFSCCRRATTSAQLLASSAPSKTIGRCLRPRGSSGRAVRSRVGFARPCWARARHSQGIRLQREATTQLGIFWRCRRAKTRAYWPVVCAVSKTPLRRHRHRRRQTGDEGREHTERGRRAAPRDGGTMSRNHGRPRGIKIAEFDVAAGGRGFHARHASVSAPCS
jgi:hypothetical protein